MAVVVQSLAKRMCNWGMTMGMGSWGRLEKVNQQIEALTTIFLAGLTMSMLVFLLKIFYYGPFLRSFLNLLQYCFCFMVVGFFVFFFFVFYGCWACRILAP